MSDESEAERIAKCLLKNIGLDRMDEEDMVAAVPRLEVEQAAAELLRLRAENARLKISDAFYCTEAASLREAIRRLADQDATLSVQGGNVTVTMDATLTEEERQAVEDAIKAVSESLDLMNGEDSRTTATLRKLLERLA